MSDKTYKLTESHMSQLDTVSTRLALLETVFEDLGYDGLADIMGRNSERINSVFRDVEVGENE